MEFGAIQQFQEVINSLNIGYDFHFVEPRNPPEPDYFCTLNGTELFVEIAHLYGTETDAKRLLGRKGKSEPSKLQVTQSTLIPLNTRLIAPLNLRLKEKALKKYNASRVWLVIRSAFPLWEKEDFEQHISEIIVPTSHPFEEIWLLCGPRARFGAIKLA